jgi:hypothetical protein
MMGMFSSFVQTNVNDKTMFYGKTALGISPDDGEMSPQSRL